MGCQTYVDVSCKLYWSRVQQGVPCWQDRGKLRCNTAQKVGTVPKAGRDSRINRKQHTTWHADITHVQVCYRLQHNANHALFLLLLLLLLQSKHGVHGVPSKPLKTIFYVWLTLFKTRGCPCCTANVWHQHPIITCRPMRSSCRTG